MKIKKILICVSVILFFFMGANAQMDFLQKANDEFNNEAYYMAANTYKKAFTKVKSKAEKAEILFKIAECYRYLTDAKQSEVWYEKAIKAKYTDPIVYFRFAEAKRLQGNFDEALVEYNNFLNLKSDDEQGKIGAEACKLAQEWKDNPTNYIVDNVPLLNSKQGDFAPTWADKKYESLIFTSTREGSTGKKEDTRTGESYSDLYYSKMDKKGKWSSPTVLEATVNSEGNEGAATLDSKKNTMYFTRCQVGKDSVYGCQIYVTSKKGQAWGDATLLQLVPDSIKIFGHPSLSKDEQLMFFAADNMPGGYGRDDIWFCVYDKENKKWGEPINAGSEINTEFEDVFPFIHDDGSLYFASEGHIGMGGLDIFKAEKLGDNKWGNVKNMKSPINSSSHDFGIIFEGEKDQGYFASDRRGGKGGDDIYSFKMPPLIFILQGVVRNIDTRAVIPDAIVQLIGTDGSNIEVKTDESGAYYFAEKNATDRYILPNTSYTLIASKERFLTAKGQETTIGRTESTTLIHDFYLQPFKDEIKFPKVLFLLDKYDLEHPSNPRDSLDYLYQTLVENPTLVIELSAHTDSRAEDNYNLTLSNRRAESCVNYFISKGINPARLVPKGYGETKLLNRCSNEVECTEEEHQQNRRVVFKVLRDDFVPKDSGN